MDILKNVDPSPLVDSGALSTFFMQRLLTRPVLIAALIALHNLDCFCFYLKNKSGKKKKYEDLIFFLFFENMR